MALHVPALRGASRSAIMKAKFRGFTLVELAIVMVIIGLLMGGVLKGQELINNAKAKSLANDFKVVAAAYYGYLDRFRVVPGDDTDASSHVGGTNATATGAGDGRITGAWNFTNGANCTEESCLFWQHVRLAGLLSGSTVLGATSFPPVNSEGGRIGISATNPMYGDSSQARGLFYVCSANISGRLASQIDLMLDDGVGNTGTVRAYAGSNTTSTTVSSTDTASAYTVCVAY